MLDPDGFLIAGGNHNQCYPTVCFAGDNYLVVWQAWIPDIIESKGGRKFGSYGLCANRVSLEGKVIDGDGKLIVDATAVAPSVVSDGSSFVLLAWIGRTDRRISGAGGLGNGPASARLDALKLEIQKGNSYFAVDKDSINTLKQSYSGLVLLPGNSAMMTVAGYKGGTTIFRIDENGRKVGECIRVHNYAYDEINVFASLAASGESVLFTQDWPSTPARKFPVRLGIWGWILSSDGKVLEGGQDGFAIVVDPSRDYIQGFACAGPTGVFLVVYAAPRAPDDTKIIGRIIKLKK